MTIFKVYVGDHYIKAFTDEYNAFSLQSSLSLFFTLENLPYKAEVKCEVI